MRSLNLCYVMGVMAKGNEGGAKCTWGVGCFLLVLVDKNTNRNNTLQGVYPNCDMLDILDFLVQLVI